MKGILLDNEFDVQIEPARDADGKIAGGLVIGDILAQNQAVILYAHKGELKETPALGAGISRMPLDHDALAWRTEIRQQLEYDGQIVEDVAIGKDGIITIKSEYRNGNI